MLEDSDKAPEGEEPSGFEVDAPDGDYGDEAELNQSADDSDVKRSTTTDADPGEGEGKPAEQEPSKDDQSDEGTSDEGEKPKEDGKDAGDETKVQLDDGTEVTLTELQDGYLRQSDYTRKTQELAEGRKDNDARAERLSKTLEESRKVHEGTVEWAKSIIPAEPDLKLLQTDPKAYHHQKAMRERATEELNKFIEKAKAGPDEETVKAEVERVRGEMVAKLKEDMPELKDDGKMASFMNQVMTTAKEFGFSEEEVNGTFDPRILQLVHFAAKGRNAQTVEGEGKPRTDSPRNTRVTGGKGGSQSNAAAVSRLKQTGSIDDAMKVDFEVYD